jgi:hypothetical protein
LLALCCALLVGSGCRDRNRDDLVRATASASNQGPSATAPAGTLPEDPDAGARASAEWHQHLQREERERRLGYDRRKLPQHHEVLKTLNAVRQSYDHASSAGAVASAQQAFLAQVPKLEQKFDAIDHWGVSSKVLPDYRQLVTTFSDAYPKARSAALAGNSTAIEQVGRDVDARFEAIDDWLREAAESADEE